MDAHTPSGEIPPSPTQSFLQAQADQIAQAEAAQASIKALLEHYRVNLNILANVYDKAPVQLALVNRLCARAQLSGPSTDLARLFPADTQQLYQALITDVLIPTMELMGLRSIQLLHPDSSLQRDLDAAHRAQNSPDVEFVTLPGEGG